MLDPALLRGQLDSVAERLRARGYDLNTAQIETLEAQRKAVQVETQDLQNQRVLRWFCRTCRTSATRARKRSARRKARARTRPR